MRDPKWMGTSPSNAFWSNDGNTLYFSWNPGNETSDSLYFITLNNKTPVKASVAQKQSFVSANAVVYNEGRTAYVYSKDGDVFYSEIKTGTPRRITQTIDTESNPQFSFNEKKIVYSRGSNLFAWDIATGETIQLTNIKSGEAAPPQNGGFQRGGGANPPRTGRDGSNNVNQQEDWLKTDQMQTMEVLRSRKEKREEAQSV